MINQSDLDYIAQRLKTVKDEIHSLNPQNKTHRNKLKYLSDDLRLVKQIVDMMLITAENKLLGDNK